MTELINVDDPIPEANKNISGKLINELLNPTLDLSIDYSEIYLDDIIENDVIKNIPIIKSVVGVIKEGISINQFWFAKKLLKFIQDFNAGNVKAEKIQSFKQKLSEDKQFGKKIAEKLMVYIDRNIEIKQTQIIANLFLAFVNEDISFEDFNNISVTLDKLNPKAFNLFFELEKINFKIDNQNHKEVENRNFEMDTFVTNSGFGTEPSPFFHGFKQTDDGIKLFKFGLKPLLK